MAGILNKRSRFIDLVITKEGKRQIASGGLRAEYASLSDSSVYYSNNEKNEEVRKRIYFETMESPNNVIVLEKDDSGKLLDFDFSPTGSIVGENIFSKDTLGKEEDLHKLKLSRGSQFASLSAALPASFLKHFTSNQFIGTKTFNENSKFDLSTNELKFAISNSVPFKTGPKKEVINVDNAEPFLLDSKLTHLPNFSYLPPVNIDGSEYGKYSDLRNLTKETWEDIKTSLGIKHFEEIDDFAEENDDMRIDKSGDYKVINRRKYLPTDTEIIKQYNVVKFKNTSDENNLLMQLFEIDESRSKLKKLDIVDAGVYYEEEDVNLKYEKRVFYVGKIFLDSFNTPTFINMFTIIMD
tara:strand:- start:1274 stop:2332 length:1059 start_codon:yes stop_codon:yes gene_type:complete